MDKITIPVTLEVVFCGVTLRRVIHVSGVDLAFKLAHETITPAAGSALTVHFPVTMSGE